MSDCPYTGKTLLEKRELPPLPPTLGKIWELSDRNNKGFLEKQDFLLAYQLIEKSQRGDVLPTAQEMEKKKCEFNLCSGCVNRNKEAGRDNNCSEGHQLYPMVNADPREWYCEECGWSPERNLDPDVLVWRCEHDECLKTGTGLGEDRNKYETKTEDC